MIVLRTKITAKEKQANRDLRNTLEKYNEFIKRQAELKAQNKGKLDSITELRIKQGIDMFKLRERRKKRPKGIDIHQIEERKRKFFKEKKEYEKQIKELEYQTNQIPSHRQMKKRIRNKVLKEKLKRKVKFLHPPNIPLKHKKMANREDQDIDFIVKSFKEREKQLFKQSCKK